MHHHNNKRGDDDVAPDKRYIEHGGSLSRKPVPGSTADGAEAPLLGDSRLDPEGGPVAPTVENAQWPITDKNAPSDFDPTGHSRTHSHQPSLGKAGAIGAGALGSAALARNFQHHRYSRRCSDLDGSFFSANDSTTEPAQARMAMPPGYEYPLVSGDFISAGAPAAALGAHRGREDGRRKSSPGASLARQQQLLQQQRRTSTPPSVPPRSPQRTRFSGNSLDAAAGSRGERPGAAAGAAGGAPSDTSHTHTSSDESSTLLLGSSIPGGWRSSMDSDRHLRLSGINPHGRSPRHSFEGRDFSAEGGEGAWLRSGKGYGHGHGYGYGNGGRGRGRAWGPTLRDLKADEQRRWERESRGGGAWDRGNESEWIGGGGGGGYNGYPVGQAL